MERREFLKGAGMILAAGMLIPKVAKSMLSLSTGDDFSLEVITDNSDYAVKLLENFIKEGNMGKGIFKYSEFPVLNYLMGDLIFVKGNELIDYTYADDDISKNLREIRNKLNLPNILSNPVRIRLYRNSGGKTGNIVVTQNGKIISKLDSGKNDEYIYYGKSGKLILNVNNNTAKVKDTECKHKICKQMNSINKPGDYITCIPNGLHIFAE
jgi:hypothetical protein